MANNGLGSGYNPDEPRDERGRWTSGGGSAFPIAGGSRRAGGASWRDRPFDGSMPERAEALAGHMALHLPERDRRRLGWPDAAAASRLSGLLDHWSSVKGLDDAVFRQRYLGNMADAETSGYLRAAAEQAAQAETQGELADAGKHLAIAAQKTGIDHWKDFLKRALERAGKLFSIDDPSQKPEQKYKIDNTVPADAVEYTAGDGTKFYAPPTADFQAAYEYGKSISGKSFTEQREAIRGAVHQEGRFDYQRHDHIFHTPYVSASNYVVGVLLNGAGYSWPVAEAIAAGYATLHSTGGWTAERDRWWLKGYDDAQSKNLPKRPPSANQVAPDQAR